MLELVGPAFPKNPVKFIVIAVMMGLICPVISVSERAMTCDVSSKVIDLRRTHPAKNPELLKSFCAGATTEREGEVCTELLNVR